MSGLKAFVTWLRSPQGRYVVRTVAEATVIIISSLDELDDK